MFWYGPFTWLLFFLVIGAAVYFIIRYKLSMTSEGKGISALESPLKILQRRLAKGEITEEEYEKIKRKLESN